MPITTTTEKTTIHASNPKPTTTTEKHTSIHTEKPASGEIVNLESEQQQQAEQQAGGIMDTIAAGVMAGVESVKDGVNYIADRVANATATAEAETTTPGPNAVTTTEKTTELNSGSNPDVEKRTKIVKEQTTYPNQQGYGVNPKFKEDSQHGAMADIKSGIKKGVENVKEKAKDLKDDVKEGARELKDNIKEGWEDTKIEANRIANNPPSAPTYAEKAAYHEAKANEFLDDRDKDLHKAAKAQAKANEKAYEANVKTAKAMNKHEIGQEYLAQAGAEMQHAGANMQAQARRY
jgi:hypothetical protein